jgi:hypothetical protein
MSEAPEPICDLAGVLRTLRSAGAALSSQADQIEQMKGMFRDEDGTIAAALEDGEDSTSEIELASLFVSALIEADAYDRAVAEQMRAEAVAHDLEVAEDLAQTLDDARTSNLPKPTAGQLHGLAREIRDALVADLQAIEDGDDPEVVLSAATAEKAIELLVGAALIADDAANPVVPDVLINCYGGIVQDVIVVAGQPKVRVFVEDNDLDERHPEKDNDLVLLQDEDPKVADFHAEIYTTNGDAFDGSGRRWTSLRSELDRILSGGLRSDLAEARAEADAGTPQA